MNYCMLMYACVACDDALLGGQKKSVRKFIFFGSTSGFCAGLQDNDVSIGF